MFVSSYECVANIWLVVLRKESFSFVIGACHSMSNWVCNLNILSTDSAVQFQCMLLHVFCCYMYFFLEQIEYRVGTRYKMFKIRRTIQSLFHKGWVMTMEGIPLSCNKIIMEINQSWRAYKQSTLAHIKWLW